jgi:formate dehydrogenase major subunit
VFKGDMDAFGKKEEFYSATTYRLTEHFHYWTKHARLNAIVQPEQFVEIGEELAKERASSRRQRQGQQQPRPHQGQGGGHQAHQALERERPEGAPRGHSVPLGLQGGPRTATSPTRSPFVGDANTQTPEFKAFLVNIEKV